MRLQIEAAVGLLKGGVIRATDIEKTKEGDTYSRITKNLLAQLNLANNMTRANNMLSAPN